mgnify:FL=1
MSRKSNLLRDKIVQSCVVWDPTKHANSLIHRINETVPVLKPKEVRVEYLTIEGKKRTKTVTEQGTKKFDTKLRRAMASAVPLVQRLVPGQRGTD